MKYYMDFAYGSLIKHGEELCGDMVEFFNDENQFVAVLSDGMGSGVKANILATLTAKIGLTMLKEGMRIEEVVETVSQTLPVCSQNKVAYSTFTMVKVAKDGFAYIVEFDNPTVFFMRGEEMLRLDWNERIINNKKIRECKIQLKERDRIVMVSDGVEFAGTRPTLNYSWQWKDIAKHLLKFTNENMNAKTITNNLLGVCNQLYYFEPADDTTVATIKVSSDSKAVLFSGPPINKKMDKEVVHKMMGSAGKKIVCGGTTANIVARELNVEYKSSTEIIDEDIPPIGYIEGIDLVTEGVLTLRKSCEILKKLLTTNDDSFLHKKKDAATLLSKILYEDCIHIKMIIGRCINHENLMTDISDNLSARLYILNEMKNVLVKLGKIVEVEYY
ncbi:MAG: SpoIIE family protein phosphatase [Clostridiales bacterium]|uniref:SpoIIE family protein phosphatase n=1 Tax=Terrisporobacter sp. TaxID=1965305 RepID=UPI002A51BA3C|nr:SpoIIE family protein phosphatase [Terrisporobacter sp.]MDD7753429.1 SpoIIE family protein phosphatase [Clostridiales bacterium]MDY4134121.1 SpoIIE family protein phosphatase [Terrisporobacter sp.]